MNDLQSYPVFVERFVVVNDKLWFVANNYNALCKMEIATGNIEIVSVVSYEYSWDMAYKYMCVAHYNGHLILIPERASELLDYDIQSGLWTRFPVEIPELSSECLKFRSSIEIGDALWITPQNCGHILSYDMGARQLKDYVEWFKIFENVDYESGAIFGYSIQTGTTIWMPCMQTNAVLEFDTTDGNVSLHHIGNNDMRANAMTYANGRFWILDNMNRELIEWEPKDGIKAIHHDFPRDYECLCEEERAFSTWRLYPYNHYIIGCPYCATSFLIIDTESGNISALQANFANESYMYACEYNGSILCTSQNRNIMLIIHMNDEMPTVEEHELKIFLDSQYVRKKFQFIKNENLYSENANRSVENFVQFVKQSYKLETNREENNYGNRIHDNVMKSICGLQGDG